MIVVNNDAGSGFFGILTTISTTTDTPDFWFATFFGISGQIDFLSNKCDLRYLLDHFSETPRFTFFYDSQVSKQVSITL